MSEPLDAIVLAGGRGTRLEPWHAPKCLIPVRGVTILQHLLEHLLVCHGESVRRAVVCTGYRARDVESSVRAHGWGEGEVALSALGEDARMGERLLAARLIAHPGRALVCYGDELADVDVRALVAQHEEGGRAVTFAAAEQRVSGGVVRDDLGAPQIVEDSAVEINIGFAVVEPQCWGLLRPEDGLSDWINRAARRLPVGVYRHVGRRATVNTLADLRRAEEVWG